MATAVKEKTALELAHAARQKRIEERIPRRVRVSLVGFTAPNGKLYAQLHPQVLLPIDYDDFKAAIAESQYSRVARRSVIPLEKVGETLRSLREYGFAVEPHPTLLASLESRSAVDWLDRRSVEERLNQIEAEFYKKKGNRFFPFQRTGASWLSRKRGALLADDMGLGKTVQTISAIPAGAPILVIGPVSCKAVWKREVLLWRPSINTFTVKKGGDFRWPNDGEMVVINYDILPPIHSGSCTGKLPAAKCPGCNEVTRFRGNNAIVEIEGHKEGCKGVLEARDCWGCHSLLKTAPENLVIVIDEAHRVKNAKTNRARITRALCRAALAKEGGRVWLLTGTPLENEPKELWGVLQTADIAKEAFDDWDTFVKLFKGKQLSFGGYNWGLPEDELSSQDISERLQRVALRRRKVDVLSELPPKRWKWIDVELKKETYDACEKYLKSSGYSLEELVKMLEEEKIQFETMSLIRAMLAKAKIPALLELVEEYEEEGEPIVVFSAHRTPIEELEKRPGWAVIKGGVSPEKRAQIEEDFQAGKLKGVGCTIRAGSEAITLTRANQAIFVDLDWAPTKNWQAEDRICRIGQTRGTIFNMLVAEHPLDQRLMEILERKTKLISMSVDKAAVKDDAPPKNDLEGLLQAVHSSIEQGVERTLAATPEDEQVVNDLHTLVFENAHEGLIAVDLAQEANLIGLTLAQWDLARKIASCGLTPEHVKQTMLEPKLKKAKNRLVDENDVGDLKTGVAQSDNGCVGESARVFNDEVISEGHPKEHRTFSPVVAGSNPAPCSETTSETTKQKEQVMAEDTSKPKTNKLALLKRDFRALTPEERREFADWLSENFFPCCAESIPKKLTEKGYERHMDECEFAADDDDEDEDEDEEAESTDDADDDEDASEEGEDDE